MIVGLARVFLHRTQLREPKPYLQNLSRNTSYHPKCGRWSFLQHLLSKINLTPLSQTYNQSYPLLLSPILTNNSSPYFSHSANEGWYKSPMSKGVLSGLALIWSLPQFLLLRSMDMDNSAHNHWFLIAQTQKFGIFQAWQTIYSKLSYALYLLPLLP